MRRSFKKIFVAAMGPGEISQGMAFARYALSKGDSVSFAVLSKSNFLFLPKSYGRFSRMLTPTPKILNVKIFQEKPDALILCNSKIFSWDNYFVNNPPVPKPLTVSIDSNWLFFKKSPYPALPWVDRYYINLPKKVFDLGLQKRGGHYSIDQKLLNKIKVVGLIPSYRKISSEKRRAVRKKLGLKSGEKLIFFYASVGGLIKPEVLEQLVRSVEELRSRNRLIKTVHVGDAALLKQKRPEFNWFFSLGPVTIDKFYEILASSDLVFQHQGLGTLAQAISAGVPVIANVRDLDKEKSPYHAHSWEVEPFMRSGACAMFYFGDPIKKIVKKMDLLLYNKEVRKRMQKKQASLYSRGETALFEDLTNLYKDKA